MVLGLGLELVWQESSPFATKNWQNIWQGGRAILPRSAGFQADRMMRRSLGLFLILWMTFGWGQG